MKTKLAKVPIEWHNNKQRMATQLGISTPQAIKLCDGVFAELLRKTRNTGPLKGGIKIEIKI